MGACCLPYRLSCAVTAPSPARRNTQDVLQRGLFMDPACPGACQPAWVLATAKEFCVAIAYLHTMDVVHGDLKSSNVLLKAAPLSAWDTRGFVAKVRGAAARAGGVALLTRRAAVLLFSCYQ